MSILNEHTKAKHVEVENSPYIQHILNRYITKEQYIRFLQEMYVVYSNLEYFAEISGILFDLPGIKRADSILQDLIELGSGPAVKRMDSTEAWRSRIVELYYSDKSKLLAHVYVRHMGDLYGGKVISKRVPGSGMFYQFEDRPFLIKALNAKLTMDLLPEALLAFDLAHAVFNDLMKEINNE
jgi:heme oxygenase